MAGHSGTASALAEVLVRIEVAHLVSSTAMVSRAYLVDNCVGVVVDAGESGFWLASALSALAPDPDGLRVRAAEKGGIPVEHGTPRLVKITLGWDESSVELKSPMVVPGSEVGVVSLAVPASLGERIRSGGGPQPVGCSDPPNLDLGDEVAVVVLYDERPLVRWARVSSDPGFDGVEVGLALDIGIPVNMAGAPVFRLGDSGPRFCGLARRADASTSVLVPTAAVIGAIPTAS